MKHTLTTLDNDQIGRYTYDEDSQAVRVTVTGDFGITEAIKNGLTGLKFTQQPLPFVPPKFPEVINIPHYFPETKIERIEVPQIIVQTEIKEIEKQVIVKEIEYREIEKPVFIKEIITVDVPVYIKEASVVQIPVKEDLYLKIFVAVNGLATVGLMILNLIKR